jgi:hypothetical protein
MIAFARLLEMPAPLRYQLPPAFVSDELPLEELEGDADEEGVGAAGGA